MRFQSRLLGRNPLAVYKRGCLKSPRKPKGLRLLAKATGPQPLRPMASAVRPSCGSLDQRSGLVPLPIAIQYQSSLSMSQSKYSLSLISIGLQLTIAQGLVMDSKVRIIRDRLSEDWAQCIYNARSPFSSSSAGLDIADIFSGNVLYA